MEAVIPFANAFVEKAGSRRGSAASELLAATGNTSNSTTWGTSLNLASSYPTLTTATGNSTSNISPGEMRSLLLQLKADEVDDLLLANQVKLIAALGDAEEVKEDELMQAYAAAATLPIPSATLVQELPCWAKQRLLADEGLPLPYALPEAVMDTMLLLGTPPPSSLRRLPRTAYEAHNLLAAVVAATAITTANALTSTGDVMSTSMVGSAAELAATAGAAGIGGSALLKKRSRGTNSASKELQVPLGVVIGQAFEQLPPSFVAEQIAEIVAKIPPKVLLQEASNIVDALPPSTLTELADRLADALPASALRQLVFEIVDPYKPPSAAASSSISSSSLPSLQSKPTFESAPESSPSLSLSLSAVADLLSSSSETSIVSGGEDEGQLSVAAAGAIPADTASLASEVAIHCSEAALRRTVAELLASIPPAALKERLVPSTLFNLMIAARFKVLIVCRNLFVVCSD